MKHVLLLGAAAAAALSISACSRKEAATSDVNPGASQPVNAAQDAVGAAVGQMSASTVGTNTAGGFVTAAATSDMYEIKAAQLAQQKARNADIKAFAKMMIADHTASSNELKPLAQAANASLPVEMDERRKGMIDNLTSANGADFDKAYAAQQVAAHEEAVTLLEGYSSGGDNAGLKAFAAKVLPKVRTHLDKARSLKTGSDNGAMAPAKK